MWKTLKFDIRYKDKPSPIEFTFESDNGILQNGQSGFGSVAYPEGSVYTGSLIYTGGEFEKYGYGEQDFTKSVMTADVLGGADGLDVYKFVGHYDYRKTDWIFGNGILYFRDKKLKPAAFIKGYFIGHIVYRAWEGEFSDVLLLPGYTPEMEIKQMRHKQRIMQLQEKLKTANSARTVLVGDSWFEFYETTAEGIALYKKDTAGKSVIGLGVGGSTFAEWVGGLVGSLLAKVKFERVIVNLGFNDLHHFCNTDEMMDSVKAFVAAVLRLNKTADIYILSISPSAHFSAQLEKERAGNAQLKSFCKANGLNFIDTVGLFMTGDEYEKEFSDMFVADGLHLNEKGYAVWHDAFKNLL